MQLKDIKQSPSKRQEIHSVGYSLMSVLILPIISVILLTVYIVYAKYEEKKLSGTLKCNQPRKLNDLQKRALKCLKQTPKIKVPKANHRFSCPPSRYTFLKKKKKDSGCTDFRCCVRAFSSCGKQGLLFTLVHRRLIAVASPVAEHRL